MSARDVREVVLARLPALGSPGERFFPDPDTDRERAWELIAREYVEALQQFDRVTLERAFARVRDNHTTGFWPPPGKFRLAALALREPRTDEDAAKRAEAEERADEYASRFRRTSKLYKEAKRDGWAGSLMGYVHAVASVQAQVIAGTKGVSWDAVLLDPASGADPREQIEALVADIRARKPDEVRVALPRGRLAAWRANTVQTPAPADHEWQELVDRLATRGRAGCIPT